MEVPKGVLPDSPPVVPEEGKIEEVIIPEEIKPTQPPAPTVPGSKTPPEHLYAALEEERRKRKEAEDKLYSLSSDPQVVVTEAFSDEGKLLEKQIGSLKGEINSLKEEKIVEALHTQYPALKELSVEFNSFRDGYPGTRVENVAKLFLLEKGLLETPRKGLERQTSGVQTPPSEGLTAEEIADLRKNNHRKYTDMLMSGKIKLDELK